MFDDSAFSDITNRELVKHNENSRTKVVNKRSISSDSNSDNESNWWERVKRSVSNFFGFESEEQKKEEAVETTKEILPPQNLISVNESEMQRKKRDHFNDDEDEDDDEDNEIGSGDHAAERNWENTTPESENDGDIEIMTPLPDIADSKYCKELFISRFFCD